MEEKEGMEGDMKGRKWDGGGRETLRKGEVEGREGKMMWGRGRGREGGGEEGREGKMEGRGGRGGDGGEEEGTEGKRKGAV